jgi:hypothetical protein
MVFTQMSAGPPDVYRFYMFQKAGFAGFSAHGPNFNSGYGIYNFHTIDLAEP